MKVAMPMLLSLLLLAALGCGGPAAAPTPTPTSAPVSATPFPTPTPMAPATPTRLPPPTPTPQPPTVPPTAPTTIRLEAPATAAPGQELTVTVWVDPQGRGVSGAQFDLTYPPELVETVTATAGPLLGANPVAFDKPNAAPGVYRYAAARVGATSSPTPPEAVATLRLKLAPQATSGAALTLGLSNALLADGDIQRMAGVTVGPPVTIAIN